MTDKVCIDGMLWVERDRLEFCDLCEGYVLKTGPFSNLEWHKLIACMKNPESVTYKFVHTPMKIEGGPIEYELG